MIPMSLAEIGSATGGSLRDVADPNQMVTGPLSIDSRHIHPGSLFAALPGTRVDGHDFAPAAVQAGAVAVLATKALPGTPTVVVPDVVTAMADLATAVAARFMGTVLALTGSAGKTSTKDLLAQILDGELRTVATERSFNNEIGFPHSVCRVEPDTDVLILEMGARGRGHIRQLTRIAPPSIGAVLGVGSAHLGEFGTKEGIAEAKGELVEALPKDGTAVLNADDPLVRAMSERTPACVVYFGTSQDADVRATDVTLDAAGRPAFTLHHAGQSEGVHLPVVGRHHVTNALAAAALAIVVGVPFPVVARRLNQATIVSGSRMEVTERPDGITIINDAFNASPESVHGALDSLALIAGVDRPSIAVLGEMRELGAASTALHQEIGRKVAALRVGRLITVGGPNAEIMAKAAEQAGGTVEHLADRDEVLSALAALPPRAVVLIKGAHTAALYETAAALAAPQA